MCDRWLEYLLRICHCINLCLVTFFLYCDNFLSQYYIEYQLIGGLLQMLKKYLRIMPDTQSKSSIMTKLGLLS